jgi:hypothetical protein
MTFRRGKSDGHRRAHKWNDWIDRFRTRLAAMWLQAELFIDADHGEDFLENGHLHWHESSGFEFGDLSPEQLAALHELLELEYGSAERCPPLLRWARVRSGMAD